jgi:hypothetical protein
MRIYLISAAAGLLLAPISTQACEFNTNALEAMRASVQTVEQVAAAQDAAPSVEDLSAAKKKTEKVEYMRSAAGPEPTPPKPKRIKVKKP